MASFVEWMSGATGLSTPTLTRILSSVAAVVILWVLRTVAVRIVRTSTDDVRTRYTWRKGSTYVTIVIGAVIIGRIWFTGVQSFITFAGLLSAGLAIALKDIVVNFAGWIFIIWRRPLSVGDRVQVGSHAGDVIDIRVFQFTLMEIGNWVDAEQSTGRILHIPNGLLFSQPLANYSSGFQYIWNEVPVLVTFESNWERAKEILSRIVAKHAQEMSKEAERRVREASKRFMIFYTMLTPTVYTTVKDSGVLLTMRYLCEPRRRRTTEEAIWEDVLREFALCADIDLAYPTQRFYSSQPERTPESAAGRPQARPGSSEPQRK